MRVQSTGRRYREIGSLRVGQVINHRLTSPDKSIILWSHSEIGYAMDYWVLTAVGLCKIWQYRKVDIIAQSGSKSAWFKLRYTESWMRAGLRIGLTGGGLAVDREVVGAILGRSTAIPNNIDQVLTLMCVLLSQSCNLAWPWNLEYGSLKVIGIGTTIR